MTPPNCNRNTLICPCALWADKAADEIERLRAALEQIRDTADGRIPTDIYELSGLARAALETKP